MNKRRQPRFSRLLWSDIFALGCILFVLAFCLIGGWI